MKEYFSHDFGARNDPKLIKVLMKWKQEGKGVYWDLIEMLYEQDGRLMLSECESYAFALRTDCELIESLINDFGLFQKDGVYFWSESVLSRLDLREAKSKSASDSARIRWAKVKKQKESESNAIAFQTQFDSNAIKVKESKLKDIKEKEIKEEKEESVPLSPPTPEEKKEIVKKVIAKKKEKEAPLIFPFDSPEFMQAWDRLLLTKKWKSKINHSLQISLDKLKPYDEAFSIKLITDATERDWQGIVFEDTPEKYSIYLNTKKGLTKNLSYSNGTNTKKPNSVASPVQGLEFGEF